MTELAREVAFRDERTPADPQAEASKLNRNALEFTIGAQKLMFGELLFLGDEMLERTRTEVALFNEFIAKMAAAHSVADVKTMWQECGLHQLDFIRRDSERIYKHGERVIATASHLIKGDILS